MKKISKYFKNKYVQIAIDGVLTTGKIYDMDESYIYLGGDTGVQMAIPLSTSPVIVDNDVAISENLDSFMENIVNSSKKGPVQ